MLEVLGADGCAEAEGCDADAYPGELVGDADDAGVIVNIIMVGLYM